MLTARAAGTVRINLQVLRTDIHLYVIRNLGYDIAGYKGGMPSSGSIKWRDAHQPVYSFFSLQIAIDIVAFDQQSNTLDPGFVTRQIIQDFYLEAAFLRPAGIHAQQHLAPVLGLRSACTRMQLQYGIKLVIRLVQQQLQFEFIHLAAYTADGVGNLCRQSRIAFFIRQLRHHRRIVIFLLQLLVLIHG
ncbi:hypothetical protein D3C75_839970 [compost metagenome]